MGFWVSLCSDGESPGELHCVRKETGEDVQSARWGSGEKGER